MPNVDAELTSLPSPIEAAEGLYVLYRTEHELPHLDAFARAVQDLLILVPELTPLQANLVMMKAVQAVQVRTD